MYTAFAKRYTLKAERNLTNKATPRVDAERAAAPDGGGGARIGGGLERAGEGKENMTGWARLWLRPCLVVMVKKFGESFCTFDH